MQISDYEFGKIAIEGQTYTSDVIITPEKVTDSWWRKEGHNLHIHDLGEVIVIKPEILVIGTGYYGRMQVPEKTRQYLQNQGIDVREAKTGDAVTVFNQLQQDCARIVAALHLTC